MKKRLTAFLCAFMALLIGFSLSRVPEKGEAPLKDMKIRQINEGKSYILREYNGRLALFIKGNSKPNTIFNVYTDNLPDMDKFKLKDGIEAENREELMQLIEDFTS